MAECVVDVDHREGELMAGLDESQRVAALSDPNRPLLLFAGAGSGKTLTMASRVCFLLVMEKVPAHKILCFCFTRQATEALRRRIRRFVPPGFQTDVDRLKIKTLHSFGLECLRRFGWVDSTTEVLDGRKQRQLAKEIVEQHALIDVQEGPKRSDIIRDKVTRLIQVAQRAKNRLNYKNTTNPAGEEAEDAHLFEIYEKQLHDELKAVDFGDLQILFCQMLELIHRDKSGMTPCDILRHCYTHIIVDEFQDLNEVQMEVLALLAGDACRVSCVGDPNQCIYGWRGALYDSFDTWKGRFPHSLSSKLEVNYRSQERIVSTANTLVEVEQRAFHSLPNPSPVYQINFSPKKHNATPAMITAKMISNLVGRRSAERNFYRCQRSSEEKDSQLRYCYGDIAVLCRTQRQVSDVIDELERNQIPVSKLRNIESTANTYITGIISYLRIIATEGTEYITNSDVEGALFNAGKNKSISGHHRKNLLLSVGATLLHSLQKVKAGEKGVGTNYYEVIQNFVFHNFSTEQFPRLGRFPKTIYKVFQQFCTIVQEGKRRIALHPISANRAGGGEEGAKEMRKAAVYRCGEVVKEVIQFVSLEGGFDTELSNCRVHQTRYSGVKRNRAGMSIVDEVSNSFTENSNRSNSSHARNSNSRQYIDVDGSDSTEQENSNLPVIKEEIITMEEEEEEVSLTQLLLSTLDKTVLFMMDEIGAEEEVEGKTPAVCTPGTVLWRLVDQFTELSEEDSLAGVKIKNAASAAASHNTSPHRSSGVTVESSGKVTVGTVHAAKGLEWPCVLLTDCNCGGFPLRVRNVQSKVFKEEKRIFYVALSRAKFDLFCLTATDGEKSPFVEEISAHLTPLSVEDIFCEYAPY